MGCSNDCLSITSLLVGTSAIFFNRTNRGLSFKYRVVIRNCYISLPFGSVTLIFALIPDTDTVNSLRESSTETSILSGVHSRGAGLFTERRETTFGCSDFLTNFNT